MLRAHRLQTALSSPRRWASSTTAAAAPPPPSKPSDSVLHAATSQWQSLVTRDVGAALLRDGFCVLPNAFPASFTRHLRDELRFLHASDQMYANQTHILLHGEQAPTLLEKRHIVETELALPAVRRQVPALEWLFDSQQVFLTLDRVMPKWLGLSDFMAKLQYNEGSGGCFPMHFDSYGDDGKCLTAVLYLNENWQDGDGGEIVLYPFPRRGLQPVVVRPLDGSLMLFSSHQMLHRVLPASQPRYCLTTWIYSSPDQQVAAEGRSKEYPVGDRDDSYELQVVDKIMRSSFRRHLAKLAHSDEWAKSLYESHRQNDAFAKYMATHEKEVEVIRAATAQMLAKFRAKDPKQPSKLPANAEELIEFMQRDKACHAMLRELPIAWF